MKKAIKSFLTLKPKRNDNVTKANALWLSTAIFLTQIADALSTKLGLELGAVEANGVMATFITEHGIINFIIFKSLAALFLIWAFWKRPVAAVVVITLYIGVVINNLIVMLQLV